MPLAWWRRSERSTGGPHAHPLHEHESARLRGQLDLLVDQLAEAIEHLEEEYGRPPGGDDA